MVYFLKLPRRSFSRQPSQIHCFFRQHLPMTDIEFHSFTLALRHGSFNKDFSPFKSFLYQKKALLLAQVSCGWMYHRNQLSASWVWFSNEFIVDFTWTKPMVWVKKSESGEASQWTWKNGKTYIRKVERIVAGADEISHPIRVGNFFIECRESDSQLWMQHKSRRYWIGSDTHEEKVGKKRREKRENCTNWKTSSPAVVVACYFLLFPIQYSIIGLWYWKFR